MSIPDGIEIRVARPGDEDEVSAMVAGFRDFYAEEEPSDSQISQVVAELIDDPRTEFLLAAHPAVGFAQLRFRPSVWTGSDDAWLEDLYVAEEERGAGIGRALTEACLGRARERGCRRIQLDANENNPNAIGLYESLGFSSVVAHRFDGGRNLYLTCWL
jgi:ribosomal protein S18 acetylase RimI-like enzyme